MVEKKETPTQEEITPYTVIENLRQLTNLTPTIYPRGKSVSFDDMPPEVLAKEENKLPTLTLGEIVDGLSGVKKWIGETQEVNGATIGDFKSKGNQPYYMNFEQKGNAITGLIFPTPSSIEHGDYGNNSLEYLDFTFGSGKDNASARTYSNQLVYGFDIKRR